MRMRSVSLGYYDIWHSCRQQPLALPLGELSPKVTERGLQAFLNGDINLCAHAAKIHMFFPLSRLCRQLSQRESQVPRVMHYTERCIEVRPCYLIDELEFVYVLGTTFTLSIRSCLS